MKICNMENCKRFVEEYSDRDALCDDCCHRRQVADYFEPKFEDIPIDKLLEDE